ncbi:MAG TPA: hypothetical protein VHK69_19305 [Chitinophagaceae bacterium]|jgi:hypothetical protein|nr:hypothetical protein [Chitinophagaceae bacterium]
MIKITAILGPVILLLSACSESTRNIPTAQPATDSIQQLVFGRFCGMCRGVCAPMYKVDYTRGQVFLDTTDSYFKNNGVVRFPEAALAPDAFAKVSRLAQTLPAVLRSSSDSTFGCPDCADGCGLYLEVTSTKGTGKFRIDYQTENLEGAVKPYADSLRAVFLELYQR